MGLLGVGLYIIIIRDGYLFQVSKNMLTKAHIPLESAFASANFRVANAENDAQTT